MAPHPPDSRTRRQSHSKMAIRVKGILKVVLDVCLYLAVNAALAVLYTQVDPYHRGFFCEDDSIRYPHGEDTITLIHILLVGILVPVLLIIGLEFMSKIIYGRRKQQRVRQFFYSVVKLVGLFLYGGALTMLITEAMKLTAGRLRPHFLDTCRPQINLYNCTHRYITDYRCSNEIPEKVLRDARKSFPSGHASLAGYVSVFIVIYVEYRLRFHFSLFLKSLLQIGALILASLCAVTRVSDNRHHWSDVIAGGVLGIIMAVWTLFCLPKHMQQQDSAYLQPGSFGRQLSTTETVMLDDHTFLYTPTNIRDPGGSRPSSRPTTPTINKIPHLINPKPH